MRSIEPGTDKRACLQGCHSCPARAIISLCASTRAGSPRHTYWRAASTGRSALDLIQRIGEHRSGEGSRFVSKYGVTRLVWFQPFMLVAEAREREYAMKKWRRDWKINLIERDNPDWDDLYPGLVGATPLRSRWRPG